MKCYIESDSFVFENEIKLHVSFGDNEGILVKPRGDITKFLADFKDNKNCYMKFDGENSLLSVINDGKGSVEIDVEHNLYTLCSTCLDVPYEKFKDTFIEFLNRLIDENK